MITAEQAREQSRDNAKIHAELSLIEKDITNSCQMGEFEVCVYLEEFNHLHILKSVLQNQGFKVDYEYGTCDNGKYKMKISWIR